MVNYQGPEISQGLVNRLHIPFFNRIEEIDFFLSDINKIPLAANDLAKLSRLEKFSVRYKGQALSESDLQTIESKVPKCKVGSIDKTNKQVDIQLDPTSPFCLTTVSCVSQ